jgi:hypothetical protein
LIKIAIYYSLGLYKGRATGEAFSPRKRTSSTPKNEISYHFLFLWFIIADPDPQHWIQAFNKVLDIIVYLFKIKLWAARTR